MMMRWVVLCATMLVVSATGAAAQSAPVDRTVFGLRLGEPLGVPECTSGLGAAAPLPGKKKQQLYKLETQKSDCLKMGSSSLRSISGGSSTLVVPSMEYLPLSNAVLVFPPEEIPSIVTNAEFGERVAYVDILDGKFEGIRFKTDGMNSDQRVLDSLKKKYGEPASITPYAIKNDVGANYNAFTALWRLKQLTVTFYSVAEWTDNRLNYGWVFIETDKDVALHKPKATEANPL